VLEVLDSKYLFRYYGPEEMTSKVKRLEEEYAGYTGRRHALALNSCTSALISALVAIGIEPGDEVIVPAYTFLPRLLRLLLQRRYRLLRRSINH